MSTAEVETSRVERWSELLPVVTGLEVQTLYARYREGRFVVNRRYQRKLVWTREEKAKFIDSVVRGMPVPLILLAEESETTLEIVDGLQRLNALFSFIENEYPIDGGYFNLDALADTKQLLDENILKQNEPVLSRDLSRRVTNYPVPQSLYRAPSTEVVDDVFRRVNSGGRKLTEHEIRQAGQLSETAEIVRKLAAYIRQDTSLEDVLPLQRMARISITSKELPYGINVDSILWVLHGVLTREQVRGSRDEELVLDLLADLLLDQLAPTGKDYRNAYYQLTSADVEETDSSAQLGVLDRATRIEGKERVIETFRTALDAFIATMEEARAPFAQLVMRKPPQTTQRYFHAIFLTFLRAARDGRHVSDHTALAETLDGIGDRITIRTGGTWSAANKGLVFEAVDKEIGRFFAAGDSRRIEHAGAWFESILSSAVTEQSAFEIKQGFLRLDDTRTFDEDAFRKAICTASAIANKGPRGGDAAGYLIYGVADNQQDAARVRAIWGVEPVNFRDFFVTGTGHELLHSDKSLDTFLSEIEARIRALPVQKSFADDLLRGLVPVRTRRARIVWVFEIRGASNAVLFDQNFHERIGPSTRIVEPGAIQKFMERFPRADG